MTFHDTNVLVTGGCGFIGTHLVEALVARGARVTVLDNFQAGRAENLRELGERVRIVKGDVRNDGLLTRVVAEAQPRIVFHLAANASVPGSVEEPAYDFTTNCAGTFALLEVLLASGWGGDAGGAADGRRVIVASSGAVYGEPEEFPIREQHRLRAISPYGASKLAAEIEAGMFHTVYGLPVVVARLFNTYGPRMARFVVLDFLRKLRENPYVLEVLGSGQQVRDFNYVSDTVAGLLLLAAHAHPGEAYNVASGSSCSVMELARTMLAALGLDGKTRIATTGRSWTGDAQHWEVSIEKISALGYRPETLLPEGVERVIAWFNTAETEILGPSAAARDGLAAPPSVLG